MAKLKGRRHSPVWASVTQIYLPLADILSLHLRRGGQPRLPSKLSFGVVHTRGFHLILLLLLSLCYVHASFAMSAVLYYSINCVLGLCESCII